MKPAFFRRTSAAAAVALISGTVAAQIIQTEPLKPPPPPQLQVPGAVSSVSAITPQAQATPSQATQTSSPEQAAPPPAAQASGQEPAASSLAQSQVVSDAMDSVSAIPPQAQAASWSVPRARANGGKKPPPSRLGQQINTTAPPIPVVMPAAGSEVPEGPTIVYPTPDAIVERTVRQIEDQQLTPEQYERLKTIFMERAQQRASPYVNPAKPVTRTLLMNLDPGVSPPILRLSRGQQTSIVFSDVSGQPWFIEKVSMNRSLFNDGRPVANGTVPGTTGQGEPPTNVLSIEPLTPAAYGNVTVTLRGQSTPVIFVLTSGQKEIDMRVDAKVPGKNPDAQTEVTLQAAPTIDNALPMFLDGVPPPQARRMKVTGLDGTEAWVYDKNLYVKARANAQYPAYYSAARSTSGVSVYRYMGVPKSVTFTTGGRALTAFFE